VAWLTAQPAEKGALQQRDIQAIGLRPLMLARDRNARSMDDMRFDAAGLQPARQPKPSRPASKATVMRAIVRPARAASSRQRYSSASSNTSFASSFLAARRSTPGMIAPTSQLDWLISITATSVLSASRAVSDRRKSFGFGMGHPVSLFLSGEGA
jgi:hypothetical protein